MNNFDMTCDNVPDYKDTNQMYIDPIIKGKKIHDELQYNLTHYKELYNIMINNKKMEEIERVLEEVSSITKPVLKDNTPREKLKYIKELKAYNLEKNKYIETHQDINPIEFTNFMDFCRRFDFNDDHIPLRSINVIPLMDTIHDKQFVLGRQRNIYDYYHEKINFITLNSKYWDIYGYLNNAFIECSDIFSDSFPDIPNKFSIRIVLSDKLFGTGDPLSHVTNYDIDYTKSTVLSKEICQFLRYTDRDLYQSIEYKNIFFISKHNIQHDNTRFLKISISKDRDELTYFNFSVKYLKYKTKYLELKKSIYN